jgi:threonine dehydrogenase-like Zn-dependent dehydrogenase
MGTAMNKGITLRMGQCNVRRYIPRLLEHIQSGRVDAQAIITHRLPLEEVSHAYQLFAKKKDHCIKTVLIPPQAA